MIKRAVLTLTVLISGSLSLFAEQTKAIYNPFSGRPDFITALTTASIQAGSNIAVVTTSSGVSISGTGGGSATPGGSPTQIQYNADGSSLGGVTSFNYYPSSNSLTVSSTTNFTGVSTTTWNNVTSMVIGDGVLLNMSANKSSTTLSGLRIPQGTDCSSSTAIGQLCLDTDDHILYVGGSINQLLMSRDILQVGTTAYPQYLHLGSSLTFADGTSMTTASSGGGSASTLGIGTGTFTSYTTNTSSPAATLSFEGMQFKVRNLTGTTAYVTIDTMTSTGVMAISSMTNYMTQSSSTANNLTLSSAAATYFNKLDLIPAASVAAGVLGSSVRASSFPMTGAVSGTYGSATQVATFTVNAQGLVTQVGNITISASGAGDNLGNHVATMTLTTGFGINSTTGVFTSSITIGSGNPSVKLTNGKNVSATLSVSGHIQISTNSLTNPTVDSSCGSGAKVAGSDATGKITTGSSGTGTSCTLFFGTVWSQPPACFINDSGALTTTSAITTTSQMLLLKTLNFATSDDIFYWCIAYE